MRTAEGQQVGAITHRAALAPLLPFQLQPDQHFERAMELSLHPLPTEGLPVLDDDLCNGPLDRDEAALEPDHCAPAQQADRSYSYSDGTKRCRFDSRLAAVGQLG